MFHRHKFLVVDVDHARYKYSKIPVTAVSKLCRCGKTKYKIIDGYFTEAQLKGNV